MIPTQPSGSHRRQRVLVLAAAIAVAVGLSLHTGLGITGGLSREFVVLPLAGVVGLAVTGLALTNFEVFVLALLVMRSSADMGKLAESGTGALDPSSLMATLFLVAAIPWLAAQRRESGPMPGSPLRTGLALFLVAGLLSVIASKMPGTSLIEWGRIAAAATMFFVLVRLIRSAATLRRVLLALALSAVIPITIGLYAAAQGGFSEEKGGFTRISSTFQQSNGFSRFLLLAVVMSVALFRYAKPRVRVPLCLFLGASSVSLLLTYTRSTWLAVAAALLIVGATQSRAVVVGILAVGVIVVMAVPSVSGRFADLTSDDETEIPTGSDGNSLAWRLSYWSEIIPLARDNPLTGIGLKVTPNSTEIAKEPHNDFLRAYVETGVVGAIAYLILIGALIRTAIAALRVSRKGLERGVAAGFAGCVTGFILVSLVANVISQVVFLWYFFALAAAAEAIVRHGGALPAEGTAEADEPELVHA